MVVAAVAFTVVDIIAAVDITAVITSVGITGITTTTAGSTALDTTAVDTVHTVHMPLKIPAIAWSTPKSVRAASTSASDLAFCKSAPAHRLGRLA
jgi:hypothetical protein